MSTIDKSLVGHIALAVVATGAAFMAWQRPAQSEHDPSVVVVGGSVDRLTQVDWDEEAYSVTIKHHGDVSTITSTNKKQADDKRNVTDSPVSDKGREIETKLAPFKAARSLGHPDEARLKELGLDEPKQSLTLHFGDDMHKLDVGGATYGSGSFYVRNSGGEVFLVPSAAISPLRAGGGNLIERMATPITKEHVERVTVTADGKSRELVQRNPDAKGKAYFTDTKHTEEADKVEKANVFVDAVLRLRILSAADAIPDHAPKFEASFVCDDRQTRYVKVWLPEASDANQQVAVVQTTLFPKGVTVSKSATDPLVRDLAAVLEPAPEATKDRPVGP